MLSHLLARSPLPPTLTLALLLLVVVLAIRQYHLQRPLPGIPHNHAAVGTIMGDIPEIRAHHIDHRRKWLASHPNRLGSPVTQILLQPFGRPFALVADFRESYDILNRRTNEFDRSEHTAKHFSPVIPEHHITMSSSDPRFKRNKELVRDLMTPAFLNNISAPQIYSKTAALIELWDLKARLAAGRPFEAAQDIWGSALDIIMGVAFALEDAQASIAGQITHVTANPPAPLPWGALHAAEPTDKPVEFSRAPLPPELHACVRLTESVSIAMSSFSPVLAHWLHRLTSKMRDAIKVERNMIRREIDLGLDRLGWNHNGPRADAEMRCAMDNILLREMNLAEKAGRKPDFHSQVIHDELMGYLVGGYDTTSTTLAWFFKFMSKYQDSQANLRRALRSSHTDASAEKRLPTIEEIVRMRIPWLDAVVEETLRLSKTFPILLRQALCDTHVMGFHIPRGTHLLVVSGGPSIVSPAIPVDEEKRADRVQSTKWRHGEWDPEDVGLFKPERWFATERTESHDGAAEEKVAFNPLAGPTLAFGGGPRGCFGRRLANLELRVVVTMLVWAFEFQPLPSPYDTLDSVDLMTSIPRDCYLRLKGISR